ncbi:MAG: hypothetical protein J5997_12600 [Oscillospiraceae bacterium]|nr:hypothetical protein [Oscillospiraceae bacterium]
MAEKEYFIDDRVIIPENVRNMTRDERRAEIARLENLAKAEKEKILKKK